MCNDIFFNDEEQFILNELKGENNTETIEILKASAEDETDDSCRNTIANLLLKLKPYFNT